MTTEQRTRPDVPAHLRALRKTDAARIALCGVRKIEEAIRDGHLTAYKNGRITLIFLNDLEAWLKGDQWTRDRHSMLPAANRKRREVQA